MTTYSRRYAAGELLKVGFSGGTHDIEIPDTRADPAPVPEALDGLRRDPDV
ncbi:hypothetical protein ACFXKD_11830 [Nocardiopsis aegyptia]|uniref:hypothetical protein n=1 Tax=Nocardiopsis aegyptia TaxID=220378 RepID=UPI00366CF5F5